jgi:hypothetical protein
LFLCWRSVSGRQFFTLKEKFMNEMRIAVAYVNASGMADLPIFVVKASPEEVSLGVH